jgi:hypothetical protein
VQLVCELPDPIPKQKQRTNYVHDASINFHRSDIGLAAGQLLGVKFAPTVIVVDASGNVQFFHAIALADWKEKLSAAIERVSKGENLASEMRAEYSKFVDEYKNNLQRLNPLAEHRYTPAQTVARHAVNDPKQPGKALWTIADLKLPGNIVQLSANQILVNDGWQSVAEVDLKTETAIHRKLDLDPEMSVTIACRSVGVTSRSPRLQWVAKSRFDADWAAIGMHPASRRCKSATFGLPMGTGMEHQVGA